MLYRTVLVAHLIVCGLISLGFVTGTFYIVWPRPVTNPSGWEACLDLGHTSARVGACGSSGCYWQVYAAGGRLVQSGTAANRHAGMAIAEEVMIELEGIQLP